MRGFSGDGVGSLSVRTLTAPSTVIANRTKLEVLASGFFDALVSVASTASDPWPRFPFPVISSWFLFLALPISLLASDSFSPFSDPSVGVAGVSTLGFTVEDAVLSAVSCVLCLALVSSDEDGVGLRRS